MTELCPLSELILVGPVEDTVLALDGATSLAGSGKKCCRHGPGEIFAVDIWLFKDPCSLRAVWEGEQGVCAPRALQEAIVGEALVAGTNCCLSSLLTSAMPMTELLPPKLHAGADRTTLPCFWVPGVTGGAFAAVGPDMRRPAEALPGLFFAAGGSDPVA